MKIWLLLFVIAGLVLAGCGKKETKAPAQPTNQPAASGNPLAAPVDYLGAVSQAKRVGQKTADLASLNKAIQLFEAQEERFPKDLNELVTKHYLPSLPAPPYGMRILYNPSSGEVKIVRQP
jgi:hypothetical protein